jgi:hypothetical protein
LIASRRGDFFDPSEAAFVLLGEAKDLEPHADLRRELLKRSCERTAGEQTIPAEEVRRTLCEKWLLGLRCGMSP